MGRNNNNPVIMAATVPWWLGVAAAVVFFIAGEVIKGFQIGLFPGSVFSWPLRMFAGLSLLGGVFSFIKERIGTTRFNTTASIADIKGLTWQEFEHLIGEYYKRRGYSVSQMGGGSPDGGIDLLAQKNGEKLVIQCKHWKAYKVDVKILRELYGVMVDSTASGAVLITSGDFTQPSMDFVKDKPIELIDGAKLVKLIAEVKAVAQKPAATYKRQAVLIPTEPPPLKEEEKDRAYMPPGMRAELDAKEKAFSEANPTCPHCKKPMVLRVAQRGPTPGSKFWGCTNYPACRQTMPFS